MRRQTQEQCRHITFYDNWPIRVFLVIPEMYFAIWDLVEHIMRRGHDVKPARQIVNSRFSLKFTAGSRVKQSRSSSINLPQLLNPGRLRKLETNNGTAVLAHFSSLPTIELLACWQSMWYDCPLTHLKWGITHELEARTSAYSGMGKRDESRFFFAFWKGLESLFLRG